MVANVDAQRHGGGGVWRELSAQQLTSPVRWAEPPATLHQDLGATALLGIGPGRVHAGLTRRTLPGVTVRRDAAVPVPAAAAGV